MHEATLSIRTSSGAFRVFYETISWPHKFPVWLTFVGDVSYASLDSLIPLDKGMYGKLLTSVVCAYSVTATWLLQGTRAIYLYYANLATSTTNGSLSLAMVSKSYYNHGFRWVTWAMVDLTLNSCPKSLTQVVTRPIPTLGSPHWYPILKAQVMYPSLPSLNVWTMNTDTRSEAQSGAWSEAHSSGYESFLYLSAILYILTRSQGLMAHLIDLSAINN